MSLSVVIVSCAPSLPSHFESEVRTNISVFENLSHRLGLQIADSLNLTSADTVCAKFQRPGELEFITHRILSAIANSGCVVVADTDCAVSAYRLRGQVTESRVSYGPAFRKGVFGSKSTARNVSLALSLANVSNVGNRVLFAGSLRASEIDTIPVSLIPVLESGQITATQATLPEETWLDRIVAPVVILGATAIIVYLFFTVRS